MAGPKYDTGLSKAQRTLLRQAIATQLAPLLKSNGGYLRGGILALPRPLKGGDPEELGWIGRIAQGQAPFVAIALGRKDFDAAGMDIPPIHFRGEIQVAIYAVSNSSRNFITGRLETDVTGTADATQDPGLDTILEHIEQYLTGASFVLGNDPKNITSEMRPQHEDEVATFGDLTVWEQVYTVKVMREVNPDRLVTQTLLTIEGKNNLDPTTTPTPPNPIVDTITTVHP